MFFSNMFLLQWDASMVTCLGRGADLHMAQMMPLSPHLLLH